MLDGIIIILALALASQWGEEEEEVKRIWVLLDGKEEE
jgi:hypothetical protein